MKLLINSLEELKKFLPRLTLKEFSSMEEFLVSATIEHILPAVGADVYETLTETDTPERIGAQRALAYYTAFEYSRPGGITITAQGLQQLESSSNKTASYGDKMDMLNFYAEKADIFLDILLDELHHPAPAGTLIASTAILQQFIPVGRSRRTLSALLPAIQYAEQFSILPIVGPEKMAEIRNMATGKEPFSTLLTNAQGAVACLALAKSIPQLTIRYKDGVVGVASFYSPSERDRVALRESLAGVKQMAEVNAEAYLNAIQKEVNPESSVDAHILTNSQSSKHYVGWF